jgi:predicted Zn-dependent peptidase
MTATREELQALSRKFLDPKRLQIFIVGDKMTRVKRNDGSETTLEEDLRSLAHQLGLPYREIELR